MIIIRESPVGLDHFLLSKTSSELLGIFRHVTQIERLSILASRYFALRRLLIRWVVWLGCRDVVWSYLETFFAVE